MQQSLIERLNNGTCDEIDREMIASRCWKVTKEVYRIFGQLEKDLKELSEDYKEELVLARFGIVVGVTDVTDENDIGFKCAFGTASTIAKIMTCILKEVK